MYSCNYLINDVKVLYQLKHLFRDGNEKKKRQKKWWNNFFQKDVFIVIANRFEKKK